jgi:hypothetical protein
MTDAAGSPEPAALVIGPGVGPVEQATTAQPQPVPAADPRNVIAQIAFGPQAAPDPIAAKLTPELLGRMIDATGEDSRGNRRHELNRQILAAVVLLGILVFTGVMITVCFAYQQAQMAEKILTHTFMLGAGAAGGYGLRAATHRAAPQPPSDD